MPRNGETSTNSTKCTYTTCHRYFETEKLMKAHKKDDPEHFYCRKCDVDCEDDRGLIKHKLLAERNGKRVHIVCDVCGQDFHTIDGLKKHRTQYHRADQNIVCRDCERTFTRAGTFAEHLENNLCTISGEEFSKRIQYMRLVDEAVRNPDSMLADEQPALEASQIDTSDLVSNATPDEELRGPSSSPVSLLNRIQPGSSITPRRHQCSRCQRVFRYASSLISHSEDSEKCGIRHARDYGERMEVITGGLLEVNGTLPQRRQGAAIAEHGVDADGSGLDESVPKIESTQLE